MTKPSAVGGERAANTASRMKITSTTTPAEPSKLVSIPAAVFKQIGTGQKKTVKIVKKLKNGMIYPAIVVTIEALQAPSAKLTGKAQQDFIKKCMANEPATTAKSK